MHRDSFSFADTSWFPPPFTSFLGVLFDLNGNTHYGWVRLSVDADRFSSPGGTCVKEYLAILDYAYEDIPGVAIPAGSTGDLCINDLYEPNNVQSAARNLNAGVINGAPDMFICDGDDQDWYYFYSVQPGTTLRIRLENLPEDYNVELWDSGGMLAASADTGTTDELIVYPNAASGIYYVRVWGQNGVFDPFQPYTLKVDYPGKGNTQTNLLPLVSFSRENNLERGDPGFQLFPNPAKDAVSLHFSCLPLEQIDLSLTDLHGKMVRRQTIEPQEVKGPVSLDISGLPEGIYWVHLIWEDQNEIIKLVISD
jgi:hypothetical protein